MPCHACVPIRVGAIVPRALHSLLASPYSVLPKPSPSLSCFTIPTSTVLTVLLTSC